MLLPPEPEIIGRPATAAVTARLAERLAPGVDVNAAPIWKSYGSG